MLYLELQRIKKAGTFQVDEPSEVSAYITYALQREREKEREREGERKREQNCTPHVIILFR